MVCLGNICRSPLAEGILLHLDKANNFRVDSAGTSAYHVGELPDSRSIEIALINGIDITNQRSRAFKIADFDKFDIIYAMDKSNFENLSKLARNKTDKEKIKLILNEIYPNENRDVPDPYFGGDNGFVKVFSLLKDACEVIIAKTQLK